MLGPALRQLFLDLEQVTDRSPYEEALYRELKPMAEIGQFLSWTRPMQPVAQQETMQWKLLPEYSASVEQFLSWRQSRYPVSDWAAMQWSILPEYGATAGPGFGTVPSVPLDPSFLPGAGAHRIGGFSMAVESWGSETDRSDPALNRHDVTRLHCPLKNCPNKRE